MKFPTDYDDRDDFFSWELESYRETNYSEIVLDLAEDCFGYNHSKSKQVDKKDAYFRCDACENHHVSRARKADNHCLNRNAELSCEERFDSPDLSMKLPTDNDEWNDFLSWEFKNYQETDYLEIVLDLSEDCFNDNDSNYSQQVYEKDVYSGCDECEHNLVSYDEKVEPKVIKDFNRIIEDTTSNVHVNQSMDHAPKKEKFSKLKKFFRFFFCEVGERKRIHLKAMKPSSSSHPPQWNFVCPKTP
ncbi:uncharacterized protein LOC111619189 [Centruroides sculpturatus]|uniref:uncharacterized protein LOC111619189 n=1 Tax=Centruroides sculpturatus TaxID=218467 RepID=UPI000C6E6B1F|nr:uncharacterized protein LOC111619189 [Centruroides sculpturatus]